MGIQRAAYRTTAALCWHCGTRFTACRASAKYCSEACKQRAKRARATPDDPRRCRSCGHTGQATSSERRLRR